MKRLITGIVLGTLLFGAPKDADAAYAVIDAKNLAEAKKQISELKKQLEELNNIKNGIQKQLNAIGEMGKIIVPTANLAKIAGQLKSDAQCLLPDFDKLMPSVEMDEQNFGSICGASDNYKKHLWVSPKETAKLAGSERLEKMEEIRARRENILVESASDGLGHADIAMQGALDLNKTAGELEAASNSAENTNSRLAVIAQGQAALIRAQGQTNQILAQQLRLQAAFIMAAGVDATNALAETGDEDKKGEN